MAQQLIVDADGGTWSFLGEVWTGGVATFTQQGADVLAQLPGEPDQLLTGQLLGPTLLPDLVLAVGPGSTAGPASITFGGITRSYDWSSGRDWWLWYGYDLPAGITIADGHIINAGAPGGPAFLAYYNQLDGPAVVQSIVGAPTWRFVLDRHESSAGQWAPLVNAQIAQLDGSFTTDPQFVWDGTGRWKSSGLCGWMDFTGAIRLVIGNTDVPSVVLWTLQAYPDGTLHLGAPGMTIALYRYNPQALILPPTNDVLLCCLTADYAIKAFILAGGTSPGAEITTGFSGLCLGGMWMTSDGRIGLSYTDTDGTAQAIYSADGGHTWTA